MAIKLYRGDDSAFADLRTITLTLNAPFDMTGWRAEFELQCLRKRIDALNAGSVVLDFSHRETRRLELGTYEATLTLIDDSRRRKTLTTSIPVEIIDVVDQTEGDDELTINVTLDSQNVTITFSSNTVGAETLDNKTQTVRASADADHYNYPTEKAVALLGDTLVSKGTQTYAVTDFETLQTLDLSSCNFADLCDLVGTLIATLKEREIIQ